MQHYEHLISCLAALAAAHACTNSLPQSDFIVQDDEKLDGSAADELRLARGQDLPGPWLGLGMRFFKLGQAQLSVPGTFLFAEQSRLKLGTSLRTADGGCPEVKSLSSSENSNLLQQPMPYAASGFGHSQHLACSGGLALGGSRRRLRASCILVWHRLGMSPPHRSCKLSKVQPTSMDCKAIADVLTLC